MLDVHAKFDEYEIPYDTIWLDIEYTDEKKYFTWNKENFATPEKMLGNWIEQGEIWLQLSIHTLKLGTMSAMRSSKGIDNERFQQQYLLWTLLAGESVWIDTLNPNSQSFWDKNINSL